MERQPPSGAGPQRPTSAPAGPPRMAPRQILALFGYSLVIWSLGNGSLPLLPLFAEDLGAGEVASGLYLSIAYAAIAGGTLVAGWVSDRYGHRKAMMLLAGVAGSPLVLATSMVTTFPQLVALTAATWWMGGMVLALTNIVGGLSAGPQERGAVLGILALGAPAGSLVGGVGVGALADALGFSGMWIVLGLLWLLCPAAGLFVRDVPPRLEAGPSRRVRGGVLSVPFVLLLLCGLSAAVGSFIASLGRSFAMGELGFSRVAITSTVAVSGLVTLPFPPIVGILSDRLGRIRFLGLSYSAGVVGLLVYSTARSLPSFWIAAALVAFVSYVSTGVASALVVDLVPRDGVGRGLALFSATGWGGAIIGFAAGGVAFESLGNTMAFLVGGFLILVGIALLAPIGIAMRRRKGSGDGAGGPEPRKE